MLLKRQQPGPPATALNQFCSIRTLNGLYTEFWIDPFIAWVLFVKISFLYLPSLSPQISVLLQIVDKAIHRGAFDFQKFLQIHWKHVPVLRFHDSIVQGQSLHSGKGYPGKIASKVLLHFPVQLVKLPHRFCLIYTSITTPVKILNGLYANRSEMSTFDTLKTENAWRASPLCHLYNMWTNKPEPPHSYRHSYKRISGWVC